MTIPKLDHIQIEICKMEESSGNKQFFVRMRRNDYDSTGFFDNLLEYQCFQSKYQDYDSCIDSALFSASFLLKFFGQKAKDVKFINFTESDMNLVDKSKRFWRIN